MHYLSAMFPVIYIILVIIVFVATDGSCDRYDDTHDRLRDHEERRRVGR